MSGTQWPRCISQRSASNQDHINLALLKNLFGLSASCNLPNGANRLRNFAGNVLGKGYTAGVGMTIGTAFGRIAGEQAARAALKQGVGHANA